MHEPHFFPNFSCTQIPKFRIVTYIMSDASLLKDFFNTIASNTLQTVSKTTVYGDIGYTQLGVTFFGALAILFITCLIFEGLARGENTRVLFRQRLWDLECIQQWKSGSDYRDAPPDVHADKSLLLGAYSIPTEKLPGLMGPGAYLSYRLMGHCTYFASLAMLYSIMVLVPIYFAQFHQRVQKASLLNMISVTHISYHNPSHMWVLVISSFIMCSFWVVVIYSEWQVVKSTRFNWEHDSLTYHFQSRYSVLVEMRSGDKPVDLKIKLANLLGKPVDEIVIVSVVTDTDTLNSLKWKLSLISAIPSILFWGKPKAEYIYDYRHSVELERRRLRENAIEVEVSKPIEPEPDMGIKANQTNPGDAEDVVPSSLEQGKSNLANTTIRTTSYFFFGFLSLFKTFRAPTYFVSLRTMASRTVLSHMYRAHSSGSEIVGDSFARITPAPSPPNIIWRNLTVDRRVIIVRKFFVRTLLVLVGFVFAIPIVKIQEYAREYQREVNPEGESAAFGSAAWRSELLSLYLPALIQVVVSQTIPRVLRLISVHYESYKTHQDVSRFVLHRTFMFQLLTVYIIVFGDVWVDFSNIQNGPAFFYDSMIIRFRRLGQDIPPVAHYFASIVILSLITETALEMIMPGKIIIAFWNKYILGMTEPWANCGMVQFRHSSSMASYIALLSIMFTFSLISPIVVLFCWCFWTLSYVWNTYAFIYLNNRKYEVSASFAPTIYSGIATTLIASQFALCVVVWSCDASKWKNHVSPQVYSFMALIVLLMIYKYVVMKNFYIHANDFTSLSMSTEIDRQCGATNTKPIFNNFYYLQPDLYSAKTIIEKARITSEVNHTGEADYLINTSS